MNSNKSLSHEGKHNRQFLELEAEIKELKTKVKQLEHLRNSIYIYTSFYRWEQERKRLLGDNYDECPLKPTK